MKIAMVYPDTLSEKAISNYSKHLIENLNKQGVSADSVTYTAGSPISFIKILSNLKKYDIIHLQHEYNLLGYYGLPFFLILPLLKIIKRNKLVITMHTAFSQKEKFPGSKIKSVMRKVLYFLQNRLINHVTDFTVVHSDFFKDILVKEYNFHEDRVGIFPHGIIETIKVEDQQKAKKELGLKGDVYLMIGNLVPVNGTDIILRQADKIGKTILVATNPKSVNLRNSKKAGGYISELKEIVEKNNSQNFVRFDLREIPYDLWWKYISAADLILLPYRGGIGSGVFSDAMAVGKPVVASNIPYFRAMEEKYKCLEIANTDSDFPRAIKEAMVKKNYAKMRLECKRYLKERGLTPVSKKYKEMYTSLLS